MRRGMNTLAPQVQEDLGRDPQPNVTASTITSPAWVAHAAFSSCRPIAALAFSCEGRDACRSWKNNPFRAAIDARDFIRARKDRETTAHLPDGTLIAIAGGKDVADPAAVIARLDKAREKYADMVLVHGGDPGVEKIAASCAERNGIQQIVCKPDWDRHGRAAPFRRNDDLLNLLPKGVIAFPGSGITENLVDKARLLGIPVQRIAA